MMLVRLRAMRDRWRNKKYNFKSDLIMGRTYAEQDCADELEALIQEHEGWVCVPREPTEAMTRAAVSSLVPAWLESGLEDTAHMEAITAYRAMIAAAEQKE